MKRFCLTAIVLLTLAAGAHAASISLTEDGTAATRIVIGEDAARTVRYAAQELQTYVARISGAELPIVEETPDDLRGGVAAGIYLGESRAAARLRITASDLAPDGFRIATPEDGVMIIVGRDHKGPWLPGRHGRMDRSITPDGTLGAYGETGTLFGVYHLLRELGCRWFVPGEVGEVVPERATIRFSDYSVTDAPHFHYRNWYGFYWDRDPEAAKWFRRAGFGGEYYINLNHSFTDWAGKYGETHPEYFATVRGKRDIYNHKEPGRVIINFMNPEVLDVTVQQALDFFAQPRWNVSEPLDWDRQMKNFPIYGVVPNDSYSDAGQEARDAGWVTEERGRAGMFSDHVWRFVNEVAKRVKDEYPDRYIGSLAYAYQFLPPLRIDTLEDNVVVMICKTRRNYWDREYRQMVREAIRGWQALEPAKIYVWEYYNVWYHPHMRGVPVIFPHTIAEDLRFMRDISSGEFVESESETRDLWGQSRQAQHAAIQGLNWYVTGRLLWDPDQDVDALLDDYFARFYGPAERPMRELFTRCEQLWADPERHSSRPWRDMFPPEEVEWIFERIEEAVALARGTRYAERMAWVREQWQVVREEADQAREWAETPTLTVPRRPAPTVDGSLDDATWEGMERLTMLGNNSAEVEELSPGLLVSHDGATLYLGVSVPRAPGTRMRMEVTEADGPTYMDESVEVFFDPTRTATSAWQIVVSASGAVLDSPPGAAGDWDSGTQSAVQVHDDHWVAELAIPLASLEAPLPTPDAPWHFDAMVNRWEGAANATYYAWVPTFGRFNTPDRFGKLVLE